MYAKSIRNTLIATSVATALGFGSTATVAETPEAQRLEAHSEGVVAALNDTVITAAVKSKMAGDVRLRNSDVDVTTNNGAVTLTGIATGWEAKSAAEMIAKSVEGVNSVRDEMRTPAVATTASPSVHAAAKATERVASDSWITTKVKSEIAADSLTKGATVGVTTLHGAVVLKGTLASFDAIEHVKEIAEKVKDVKSVDTTGMKIATT